MQNVIIHPRNQEELQLVTQLMKRMKIKAHVVEESQKILKARRKQEILDSIERGLTEIRLHQEGKITLQPAHQVLDEL